MAEIPVTVTNTTRTTNIDELHASFMRRLREVIEESGGTVSPTEFQRIDSMLYGLETAIYEDMLTSVHRHDYQYVMIGNTLYKFCTDNCNASWKLVGGVWYPCNFKDHES